VDEKLSQNEQCYIGGNSYWLSCSVNKGLIRKNELGRFYLNLKPEYAADFFNSAAETFQTAGLNSKMKIPRIGEVNAFNRLDKMVIYFDVEEEQKTLQILERLYQNNLEMFDKTGTPRFTAEVKDSKGTTMAGIGFGEEPIFSNESFGTIRAKILVEVYVDAKNSLFSIFDSRFDFEAFFRKACIKYQVDPINPAFNLSRGQTKFEELKHHLEPKNES